MVKCKYKVGLQEVVSFIIIITQLYLPACSCAEHAIPVFLVLLVAPSIVPLNVIHYLFLTVYIQVQVRQLGASSLLPCHSIPCFVELT